MRYINDIIFLICKILGNHNQNEWTGSAHFKTNPNEKLTKNIDDRTLDYIRYSLRKYFVGMENHFDDERLWSVF